MSSSKSSWTSNGRLVAIALLFAGLGALGTWWIMRDDGHSRARQSALASPSSEEVTEKRSAPAGRGTLSVRDGDPRGAAAVHVPRRATDAVGAPENAPSAHGGSPAPDREHWIDEEWRVIEADAKRLSRDPQSLLRAYHAAFFDDDRLPLDSADTRVASGLLEFMARFPGTFLAAKAAWKLADHYSIRLHRKLGGDFAVAQSYFERALREVRDPRDPMWGVPFRAQVLFDYVRLLVHANRVDDARKMTARLERDYGQYSKVAENVRILRDAYFRGDE